MCLKAKQSEKRIFNFTKEHIFSFGHTNLIFQTNLAKYFHSSRISDQPFSLLTKLTTFVNKEMGCENFSSLGTAVWSGQFRRDSFDKRLYNVVFARGLANIVYLCVITPLKKLVFQFFKFLIISIDIDKIYYMHYVIIQLIVGYYLILSKHILYNQITLHRIAEL